MPLLRLCTPLTEPKYGKCYHLSLFVCLFVFCFLLLDAASTRGQATPLSPVFTIGLQSPYTGVHTGTSQGCSCFCTTLKVDLFPGLGSRRGHLEPTTAGTGSAPSIAGKGEGHPRKSAQRPSRLQCRRYVTRG